jgi:hypothetical protein
MRDLGFTIGFTSKVTDMEKASSIDHCPRETIGTL